MLGQRVGECVGVGVGVCASDWEQSIWAEIIFYRGGDLVGRVVRKGLVRSVEVILNRLWSHVQKDAPALSRRHGGMGFHPPKSVAVFWPIAPILAGRNQAADPVWHRTV